MTIPRLLTLAQAREHLRTVDLEDDVDLQLKIDAATQLVCEYISDRQPADEDWIATIEGWDGVSYPSTAPPVIVAAVLQQVAELYRFRGDDVEGDLPKSVEHGALSPLVARLLHRYRSPTLA